jgi:hypothetical protein
MGSRPRSLRPGSAGAQAGPGGLAADLALTATGDLHAEPTIEVYGAVLGTGCWSRWPVPTRCRYSAVNCRIATPSATRPRPAPLATPFARRGQHFLLEHLIFTAPRPSAAAKRAAHQ